MVDSPLAGRFSQLSTKKVLKLYTVGLINTVSGLDKDQWDEMGDSPLSSYGWLKTVEKTHKHNIEQKYILVNLGQRLVGGAVYYISKKRNNRVSFVTSELLGRLNKFTVKLGISFLPAIICGSRGEHLLVDKKCDSREREAITNTILDTLMNEARKKKLPICFPYLDDNERSLMMLLKKRGFNHTPVTPYMYIDIRWSTFEDYVKDIGKISKNMKKSLLNEIKRNKKMGVRIEIETEPRKHEDRLYELINKHYLKHTGSPFHFKKEFIHKVQENSGQQCRFYISWKNGVITGTSFSLIKNDVEYSYLTAVERKLAGNDMTFFNMGFHMKARRGCKAGNLYFYYKASEKITNIAIKPWFIFLSKWYQRKNAISYDKSRQKQRKHFF